jgi:hypothetical protein
MEHARYSSSQQLPFTTNIHEKVTKGKKKRKKQRKTEEHEGTKTAWAGEKLKQNECSNSRKEQDHSHVKPFTEQTKKASNKVGESNK